MKREFYHPHLPPLPPAGEEVNRIPKEVDCFCTNASIIGKLYGLPLRSDRSVKTDSLIF